MQHSDLSGPKAHLNRCGDQAILHVDIHRHEAEASRSSKLRLTLPKMEMERRLQHTPSHRVLTTSKTPTLAMPIAELRVSVLQRVGVLRTRGERTQTELLPVPSMRHLGSFMAVVWV